MAENSSTVDITVRCAFHSVVEDIKVSCSADWTVLRLKEHLQEVAPSKPLVATQRLIFSGSILRDEKSIAEVLGARSQDGTIFFHLATTTPQALTVQKRATSVPTQPAAGDAPSSATTTNPWSAYYAQYSQMQAHQPSAAAAQAYYANYYANYMNYYQQYLGANGMPAQIPGMVQVQNVHGGVGAFDAAAVANVPNEAGAIQGPGIENMPMDGAAVEGEVGGAGVDILERGYRLLRLALLLSLVFMYATIERALLVVAVILFVLFVQMRRAQAREDEVARRQAEEARREEERRMRENGNNNDGEGEEERGGADQPDGIMDAPAVQEVRTGLQVFVSTCYLFVTTFFTSLVPENPRHMDVN
ncbi:hypothetical protein PMAYCL1PPCAC_23296 [Pristionchus mayeri]|uniref:Ubiquitin-like domain-containing protein n=1 Tax=Pristionchus mayeri TaxID=1317129 RepID=A0AAN5I7A9_9BILA|nr:hypothetical protein PMAYCL1PPCAC_23296 [Pristionchus mayeri]